MAVPSLPLVPPRPVPELALAPVPDVGAVPVSELADAPATETHVAGSDPAQRSYRWLIEWLAVLVVALLLALGVRTFVAQMFYIPSGSMLPTLQIGDRIVVDKLSYELHSVHRGDIVVFRRPPLEQDPYSDLVKRVIGLPGDVISTVGGHVYIDGKPLAEPWLPQPQPPTLPSPLPYAFSLNRPYTVPPGDYFVMGDNRTDSEDSRYFGPISGSLIVGKVAFVIWPLDATGWMVVLSILAGVVLILLVVTVRAARHAPRPGAVTVRGPPVSDLGW
jgi:signal peptidase I